MLLIMMEEQNNWWVQPGRGYSPLFECCEKFIQDGIKAFRVIHVGIVRGLWDYALASVFRFWPAVKILFALSGPIGISIGNQYRAVKRAFIVLDQTAINCAHDG